MTLFNNFSKNIGVQSVFMDHPLQSLSVRTGCVLSFSHHIPGGRALGEEGISLSFIVTVFCLVVLDSVLSVSIWLCVCGNVKEFIRSSEAKVSLLQHLPASFPGYEKHCSYPGKEDGHVAGFSVTSAACLTTMCLIT